VTEGGREGGRRGADSPIYLEGNEQFIRCASSHELGLLAHELSLRLEGNECRTCISTL
jgi:hypothetical protein